MRNPELCGHRWSVRVLKEGEDTNIFWDFRMPGEFVSKREVGEREQFMGGLVPFWIEVVSLGLVNTISP